MSIKELRETEESFVSGKKEVIINHGGKKLKFYAKEIGFLGINHDPSKSNIMAQMVAASIMDEEGNQFTYEEVMRLKKEFADPLFKAVMDLHGKLDAEKN